MAFPPLSCLHPIAFVVLEVCLTASCIGFTSNYSHLRLAGLPLVAACTWTVLSTCRNQIFRIFWVTVIAGNAPTYLLRYLDLVLLDKWDFGTRGPTRAESSHENAIKRLAESRKDVHILDRQSNAWERMRFGFNVTLSPRQVNTPFQVKNVPPWSCQDRSYVPSRASFLRRTAMRTAMCYLLVDLCSLGADPENNAALFSATKVPLLTRLGQVDSQELVVRIFASLMLWLNVVCIFYIFHGLVVFVAVASGISKVKDWPPPFGSLSDAYTVRKFWGIYWHQMYRQTFGGPARFLIHDVLRIPKGTLTARYGKILATFLISGLLHMSVDLASGMTRQESGSVQFFCTQALGIILEDSVQALYQRYKTNLLPASEGWTKVIGYIWLGVFLVWSTPVWAYPAIRRDKGREEDIILPVSIAKLLMGRKEGLNDRATTVVSGK